ncbi:hypothetical protein IC620_14545 [Hazenella sp. IB182357]|uniref:Uncharacterized protein n=1 Tax=Polycladospora coralii TaxID=2771432 RepID=A0A926N6T8_9BACL|nr:hypothetical protein [Polycladospora coralii]MBD1373564.1 hypothetical protein [Polycladospora coralii]MBS7531937.1 hypothetical protein [Polycladospora coralii]
MADILNVTIDLNTDRFVTNFQPQAIGHLSSVVLGILETLDTDPPSDVPEFTVGAYEVRAVFNRTIGDFWNDHTLIEKGVKPPPNLRLPIFRVNYSPSLENIARGVFQAFSPVVTQLFRKKLVYVTAKNSFYSSTTISGL